MGEIEKKTKKKHIQLSTEKQEVLCAPRGLKHDSNQDCQQNVHSVLETWDKNLHGRK